MLLGYINSLCMLAETRFQSDICEIKYSPQAQAVGALTHKRKRASCSAPLLIKGSATVEAALVLPLFLCAICFLIMMGQLLLIEGEIAHAVSKTAFTCAKQEAVREVSQKKISGSGLLAANMIFYSLLQGDDLCKECIEGGKHGILVRAEKLEGEEKILVKASYILKIPVPFFGGGRILRNIEVKRRIYTGYLPHGSEAGGDNKMVFVTDHGSVYHTSLSCSHVSLKISANALSVKALEAKGFRACEKCIKKGSDPKAYYITAEGDCYHSRLSCSGLKRTVKSATISEVGGLKKCSRCAGKSGK